MGQDTKHHSMNDLTHHTAKAAVVLLGGRSLPQTVLRRGTALKTERIEGSEKMGKYAQLVMGGSVKNSRKSKESSPLHNESKVSVFFKITISLLFLNISIFVHRFDSRIVKDFSLLDSKWLCGTCSGCSKLVSNRNIRRLSFIRWIWIPFLLSGNCVSLLIFFLWRVCHYPRAPKFPPPL